MNNDVEILKLRFMLVVLDQVCRSRADHQGRINPSDVSFFEITGKLGDDIEGTIKQLQNNQEVK